MRDRFNTELTEQEAAAYAQWATGESKSRGRDVLMDENDYDLRGYWKNEGSKPQGGHMTDTYKKPNHPTFSNESMYNNALDDAGTPYIGGAWGNEGGMDTYTPSERMLNDTHGAQRLQQYFKQREPGVQLILPKPKGY